MPLGKSQILFGLSFSVCPVGASSRWPQGPFWLPQSCEAAAGPKAHNCTGGRGREWGRCRANLTRTDPCSLWAAFPAQLRLPLTSGSSKHSKETAFGVYLLRRGMGHWPGVRHLGQLTPGSGPHSAQTSVLLPDHPHTWNTMGLSEVTRVKPPLGMRQGHMGVGPQGLFPRTRKRLDRDP